MNYLFTGKLDNKIHDVTYEQIKLLHEDNKKELKEGKRITKETYLGERNYKKYNDAFYSVISNNLNRLPKTDGVKIYYPHGIIIRQSERRNFYRGENQVFNESVPTLLRKLNSFSEIEDKEIYRLISDMRIAEFSLLLKKFDHVLTWDKSDVLYEVLAQHYGLETGWLDITSDFDVALFFATCYYENGKWKPLTKSQTEVDEQHKYGMIFHMPSNHMSIRWLKEYSQFKQNDIYNEKMDNLIYPIGFQPFMRCHMQNGYGIYMRTPKPLQNDVGFEKLRFRHSEELSKRVFDAMQGGEKIYPHEGLQKADFIIENIKNLTDFSEEAFKYALYRNHYFKLSDAKIVKEKLKEKKINIISKSQWKISSGRKNKINEIYKNFSVESWYNIMVIDTNSHLQHPLPEPWMIPEENDGEGINDFHIRDKIKCGLNINDQIMLGMHYALTTKTIPDF